MISYRGQLKSIFCNQSKIKSKIKEERRIYWYFFIKVNFYAGVLISIFISPNDTIWSKAFNKNKIPGYLRGSKTNNHENSIKHENRGQRY